MKRKIFDVIRLIWKIKFLEFILVKLTIGKTFGNAITKFPPNHYQYSKGSLRIVKRNGINFQLDISDTIDWFIYFGFKERSRLNLYKLLHKGEIIIDVGANIGDVSLNASKEIGPSGMIHSFEPDLENYTRLKKNISLNSSSNIKTINKGLGDKIGIYTLYQVNQSNKGMNRILIDPNYEYPNTKIDVTTIDTYISENKISKVDLIKIDVEGFEMKVLKGSESTIDKFHPTLFIEIDENNLKKQNNSSKEIMDFLSSKGYRLYFAENGAPISKNFNFTNCHFDLIGKKNSNIA